MFSRSPFWLCSITPAHALALCALLLIAAMAAFKVIAPRSHTSTRPQLTVETAPPRDRAGEAPGWRRHPQNEITSKREAHVFLPSIFLLLAPLRQRSLPQMEILRPHTINQKLQ